MTLLKFVLLFLAFITYSIVYFLCPKYTLGLWQIDHMNEANEIFSNWEFIVSWHFECGDIEQTKLKFLFHEKFLNYTNLLVRLFTLTCCKSNPLNRQSSSSIWNFKIKLDLQTFTIHNPKNVEKPLLNSTS